jgi:hypothetical protein
MLTLKALLTKGAQAARGVRAVLPVLPARAVPAVCIWGGEHTDEVICYVEIERECGHVERGIPVCMVHVQQMLVTGGAARRPAPCFEPGCDQVSFGRITGTQDIAPLSPP